MDSIFNEDIMIKGILGESAISIERLYQAFKDRYEKEQALELETEFEETEESVDGVHVQPTIKI